MIWSGLVWFSLISSSIVLPGLLWTHPCARLTSYRAFHRSLWGVPVCTNFPKSQPSGVWPDTKEAESLALTLDRTSGRIYSLTCKRENNLAGEPLRELQNPRVVSNNTLVKRGSPPMSAQILNGMKYFGSPAKKILYHLCQYTRSARRKAILSCPIQPRPS